MRLDLDPARDALQQISEAQQTVDETRAVYDTAKATAAARKGDWEDAVEMLGVVIKRVCHLPGPLAPLLALAEEEPTLSLGLEVSAGTYPRSSSIVDSAEQDPAPDWTDPDPELDPELEDEDEDEDFEEEDPEDEDPEQEAVCQDVHEDGMLAWVCSLPTGHAGEHVDQGAQHRWPRQEPVIVTLRPRRGRRPSPPATIL